MDKQNNVLIPKKTLYILKEIELNPQATQRALAQKLEVSLGKINFLINAFIDKGLIEIKNFKNSKNKLAYKYLLTTHGLKVNLQLIQKFFIWKTQEYEKLRDEIELLRKEVDLVPHEEGEAQL